MNGLDQPNVLAMFFDAQWRLSFGDVFSLEQLIHP
jgi:hypothetical protein